MTVLRPLPPGMIVVVGWMMVPLAERSTTGCGAGGCFLAAAAGITQAAMRPLNATPAAAKANPLAVRLKAAPARLEMSLLRIGPVPQFPANQLPFWSDRK